MASIERTAYPRFKRNPLAKELDALYTPTKDELDFARAMARKESERCELTLWWDFNIRAALVIS